MKLLDLFLVFYGYLSIYFGWFYYAVVFLSFAVALYAYLKERSIFETADRFIASITYLGILDLLLSAVISSFLTFKWLFLNH